MDFILIAEITLGVLLGRVAGDALAAVLIVQRGKKKRAAAYAQLEQWEKLLAETESKRTGPAEITD